MSQKNKEAWAIKKLESIFSLDAPMLTRNESFTHLEFIKGIPHDDTIIDVEFFMEGLLSLEKEVVHFLFNGQDLFTISDELRLSLGQVESVVKQLQSKAVYI